MTSGSREPDRISADLIEIICERIAKGQRVRRFLPGGGTLHLERQLPFLALYRRPVDRDDAGTASLITGQSSYLSGPGDERHLAALRELLSRLTELLLEIFDAFLLVEVWSAHDLSEGDPEFIVVAPTDRDVPEAAEKLASALRHVRTPSGPARAEVRKRPVPSPPGLLPLLPRDRLPGGAVLPLGLEIQPFFRDPDHGSPYPQLLRRVQRSFSAALLRGFYEFVRLETFRKPPHFHVLGRGSVLRVVWEADRKLSEIASAYDFLLAITPTNAPEAWKSFRRSGYESSPPFRYRLLDFDPAVLKRRLHNIRMDPLEDPALTDLLREKRNELDIQLTMLEHRRTPRFLFGSLQLHGRVDDELRQLASSLLHATRPPDGAAGPDPAEGAIDAEAFARWARGELKAYRRNAPDFDPAVEIRSDISSLMVSRGNLLIPADVRMRPSRARALIQHEVGTHMLTYFNGTRQPLTILKGGLPGAEELQEGVAVLAEFLVGSLGPHRLRLLAARVLAADCCARGATFVDTFRFLSGEHGFRPRTAFQVAMRVHRGGGHVKDQVYLKGLARLLRYLAADGALQPLYVGKVGMDHVKTVEELLWRDVLEPPALEPRFLHTSTARRKLKALRKGVSVLDLVPKEEEWRSASW